MKSNTHSAVGKRVADVELCILLALVRLNGKVESVVSLRSIRLQLQCRRQSSDYGTLPLCEFDHRFFRQDDLEALRAPLRARRITGVMNKIPFQNMELAVGG